DQGVANIIRFNYFKNEGAFTRDKRTETYSVNFEKMKTAMLKLAEEILTIQGEGNYEAAKKLVDENGYIKDDLLNDLYRIQYNHIPKDICFIQGKNILNLE
ncbi:MAG: Zn-dependent hydrolase, partial [Bacteroidota bacterium]|nr:Zn-dependent hydrolase [Bacteroidota bacterium]